MEKPFVITIEQDGRLSAEINLTEEEMQEALFEARDKHTLSVIQEICVRNEEIARKLQEWLGEE